MNKKLFFPLVAALFTLSFVGCGDTVVEDLEKFPAQNQSIETAAKLTIVVKDALDGTVLDAESGVSVTLLTNNKAGKEVAPGTFVFDSVYVGSHRVLVSKEGDTHAEIVTSVAIDANTHESVSIARNTSAIVELAPLKAGLEGYLYYENKDGRLVPAQGVNVQVQFSGSTSNSLVTKIYNATKTDKDGKYTFTKLPVTGDRYDVIALAATVGDDKISFQPTKIGTYPIPAGDCIARDPYYGCTDYATTNLGYLSTGAVPALGIFELTQTQGTAVFAVTKYNSTVDVDGAVEFVFSGKADATKLIASSVTVSASEVVNLKWSDTYDTLTITPASKWNGTFGSTAAGNFTVTFGTTANKFVSDKGVELKDKQFIIIVNKKDISEDVVKNFRVIGVGGNFPKKDSLDFDGGSLNFTWTALEGAEGYIIFRKTNLESNFTQAGIIDGTTNRNLDTITGNITTSLRISSSSGNDIVHTVEYLIQAFNTQYKTKLNPESALKIHDIIAPKASNYGTETYAGYSFGTSTDDDGNNEDAVTVLNVISESVIKERLYDSKWDADEGKIVYSAPADSLPELCINFSEPMNFEDVKFEFVKDTTNTDSDNYSAAERTKFNTVLSRTHGRLSVPEDSYRIAYWNSSTSSEEKDKPINNRLCVTVRIASVSAANFEYGADPFDNDKAASTLIKSRLIISGLKDLSTREEGNNEFARIYKGLGKTNSEKTVNTLDIRLKAGNAL